MTWPLASCTRTTKRSKAARRRPFNVGAIELELAAVARALEAFGERLPSIEATQVSAYFVDCIHTLVSIGKPEAAFLIGERRVARLGQRGSWHTKRAAKLAGFEARQSVEENRSPISAMNNAMGGPQT